MTSPAAPDGLGLYVHWPFCQSKCPYCDFNSHVAEAVDHGRWLRAYRREIARLAAETGRRPLATVFFGGGTPSLMPPRLVVGILEAAAAAWSLAWDAEITLEANPGSAEAGRFRGYREAGVNRLSLGLQALNDEDLRRLGRLHSAAEGRAAFALARGLFPRTSLDLIYARQRQTPAAWREELGEALALGSDHLSLYQLTIEEGTPFAVRARAGRLPGLPDEDRAVALYDLTQELCEAAGRPAYEVSNHARPGGECRHNLIYWRSGDFAAIGPGAHGRLTLAGRRLATEAHRNPRAWLEAVEAQGSGESRRAALTLAEAGEEYALMGLRLPEGIALDRLAAAGIVPDPARRGVLADLGLIDIAAGRLRVTRRGRLVLDRILGELLAR